MAAKVFVSCGQRPPEETKIANEIKKLLKDKYGLETYIAFKIQSFDDVMQITKELGECDYYLFIDFKREELEKGRYRGSLFTHQELAIARHLGFSEIIALQQDGVVLEGFAQYILSNPERFQGESDLLNKIERLVKERGWNADYSRNLIVERILKNLQPTLYRDHSLVEARNEIIWHCQILNKRNDKAAVNTLAILKEVEDGTKRLWAPDTTFLKWAFQLNDYRRTIFPKGGGRFDLLAVDVNNPSRVYLHSLLDTYTPTATGTLARQPIIDGQGLYKLTYQVFAENFPLLEFKVALNLTGDANTTGVVLL